MPQAKYLYPSHIVKGVAVVNSLIFFLVWLFGGPHRARADAAMDQALGNFISVQLVTNIAVLVFNMVQVCPANEQIYILFLGLNNGITLGFAVLWTNLLTHRSHPHRGPQPRF